MTDLAGQKDAKPNTNNLQAADFVFEMRGLISTKEHWGCVVRPRRSCHGASGVLTVRWPQETHFTRTFTVPFASGHVTERDNRPADQFVGHLITPVTTSLITPPLTEGYLRMIAHAYAAGGHRNNLVVGERGPAPIIRDQLWIKRAGAIAHTDATIRKTLKIARLQKANDDYHSRYCADLHI